MARVIWFVDFRQRVEDWCSGCIVWFKKFIKSVIYVSACFQVGEKGANFKSSLNCVVLFLLKIIISV